MVSGNNTGFLNFKIIQVEWFWKITRSIISKYHSKSCYELHKYTFCIYNFWLQLTNLIYITGNYFIIITTVAQIKKIVWLIAHYNINNSRIKKDIIMTILNAASKYLTKTKCKDTCIKIQL